MLEKILLKMLKKEKALGLALSFVLGASSTALGLNAEVVKRELCSMEVISSE